MKRILAIIAPLTLAVAGCQPSEQPPVNNAQSNGEEEAALYLAYEFGSGGQGTGDQRVLDACFLAGPDEHVALVELLAKPEHQSAADCAYYSDYWPVEASTLRTGAGSPPDRFSAILLSESFNDAAVDLHAIEPGDHELWSLRTYEGTDKWFVMRRIPVTLASNPNELPMIEGTVMLPPKWSSLVHELANTRDNYDQCGDSGSVSVNETRQMTDDEFAVWVTTSKHDACRAP